MSIMRNSYRNAVKYDTYQEAKIENPDSNIVVAKLDSFSTVAGKFSTANGFYPAIKDYGYFNDYYDVCNPADYCQSLEQFLEEGKLLHEGDLILTKYGNVFSVGSDNQNIGNINTPNSDDNITFILKAKEQSSKYKTTKRKQLMINYPTQEDVINNYIDFVTCINYKHIVMPFMRKEINSDEMLQRLVEGLKELEQTHGDKLIYKVGVDYNVVVDEIDSRHVDVKTVMIEH